MANNGGRRGGTTTQAPDDPKLQPHSVEAEQSILAAILLDNSSMSKAMEILTEDDFYYTPHQKVYQAMRELAEHGEGIDQLTLSAHLREHGALESVGGLTYLAELRLEAPTAQNIRFHSRIVKDHAVRRRLIVEAQGLVDGAYAGDEVAGLAASVEDLAERCKSSGAGPSGLPVLIRMDTVPLEEVQWLWPGRIACRKFALIIGVPGLGKSYLACEIAARFSRGTPWPDGLPAPQGRSILLSAEDGLSDTIAPRLALLGADRAAIHVLRGIRERGTERPFDFSRDLTQLDRALRETRAQLVIVDPLSAYLGGIDSYKDAEVRSLLAPLVALAETHAVAVMGIVHLTKEQQQRLLYRAAGSIAFVAAARTVLAVGADPEAEERRLLFAIKSNLTALPPALAFRITAHGFAWEPGPVPGLDADDIFGHTPPPSADERETRAHAVEFLSELLRHGPQAAEQVLKEGERYGFTRPQLQRARTAAHVRTRKLSFEQGWEWTLDGTKNTPPSPPVSSSSSSSSSWANPAKSPNSTEDDTHHGVSSSQTLREYQQLRCEDAPKVTGGKEGDAFDEEAAVDCTDLDPEEPDADVDRHG